MRIRIRNGCDFFPFNSAVAPWKTMPLYNILKTMFSLGTEIKAITYNSMSIKNHDEDESSEKSTGWDLHVLVDI